MATENNTLHTLINHHFCIHNAFSDDILRALNIEDSDYTELERSSCTEKSKLLMEFIYNEDSNKDEKNILLFEPINNWSYLMWNVWDFDRTKKMALHLSQELNTKVFYFFINPWIFTYRWIFADNGELVRAYFQSHGKDVISEGFFERENVILEKLKKDKNSFWEDEYWNINSAVCQPIDIINTLDTIRITKGIIKITGI